jgi:hypothetical protein
LYSQAVPWDTKQKIDSDNITREDTTYTFTEPFPGFDFHNVQAPRPKMKLPIPTTGLPAPMTTISHQTKPMILSSTRPVYLLIWAKGSDLGVKLGGRESSGMALSDGEAVGVGGRSRSATIGF